MEEPKVVLEKVGSKKAPLIQNMARFYVYDLSRDCGQGDPQWALPNDGLYESFDFGSYFTQEDRRAFLIKVGEEVAGFVLLNQACLVSSNTWNVGEFFVLARFQGRGVAKKAARQVWSNYPGKWEVSVIPENVSALSFWKKAISAAGTSGYDESIQVVDFDPKQPNRILFQFEISA